MVSRYPHDAVLHLAKRPISQDEKGDISVGEEKITLRGRFEPVSGNAHLGYVAKFYAPLRNISPLLVGGAHLVYGGRLFCVSQLFNYQNHCEICLS